MASSTANKVGGGVFIYNPTHSTGASRVRQRFDASSSDEQSSEATAKTDMGGGMLGGLMGGGSEGGGFGLGGLVSGITGALGFGKKPGGYGATPASGEWGAASGGPHWGLILILGGCALGVAFLLFGFLRKD